jgi:ketosteroid isomerase-like protein
MLSHVPCALPLGIRQHGRVMALSPSEKSPPLRNDPERRNDRAAGALTRRHGAKTMARYNSDEVQIRELIDRWAGAIRDKNIEAAVTHYARDILLYDLAPPLVHRGVDMYKKELAEWFATFQGAVGFEVHDLSITVGDGAAFATSLNHITGKRANGEQTDVWVRATIGFARKDGGWKATHEHFSVPFYMDGSDKAAVDLKP